MSFTTASRSRSETAGGGVLFWAERDPAVYRANTLLLGLLLSPCAFFAPDLFIVGIAAALAASFVNRRAFRFELTADTLRLKSGLFLPALRIPLRDIAAAQAASIAPSRLLPTGSPIGVVRVKLRCGPTLPIVGIIDAEAAADAIRTLVARARATAIPAGGAA